MCCVYLECGRINNMPVGEIQNMYSPLSQNMTDSDNSSEEEIHSSARPARSVGNSRKSSSSSTHHQHQHPRNLHHHQVKTRYTHNNKLYIRPTTRVNDGRIILTYSFLYIYVCRHTIRTTTTALAQCTIWTPTCRICTTLMRTT